MNTIAIKDITEDTFEMLNTRLPVLPAGLGSFKCKNPYMLTLWRDRFIRFYGNDGILYLDWVNTNQVEGNEKYDKDTMGLCTDVMNFGNLD